MYLFILYFINRFLEILFLNVFFLIDLVAQLFCISSIPPQLFYITFIFHMFTFSVELLIHLDFPLFSSIDVFHPRGGERGQALLQLRGRPLPQASRRAGPPLHRLPGPQPLRDVPGPEAGAG